MVFNEHEILFSALKMAHLKQESHSAALGIARFQGLFFVYGVVKSDGLDPITLTLSAQKDFMSAS